MMQLNHLTPTTDVVELVKSTSSCPNSIETRLLAVDQSNISNSSKCDKSNEKLPNQHGKKISLKLNNRQQRQPHVPTLLNHIIILSNICLIFTTFAITKANCNRLSTSTSGNNKASESIDSNLIARESNFTSYFLDRDANQSTSATTNNHLGDHPEATAKGKKRKKSRRSKLRDDDDDDGDLTLDFDSEDENEIELGRDDEKFNKLSDGEKTFDDFDDIKAFNLSRFYSQDEEEPPPLSESMSNQTKQKIIEQFYEGNEDKLTLPSDVRQSAPTELKGNSLRRGPTDQAEQTKPKDSEAQPQQQRNPIVVSQQLDPTSCAMQRQTGQCISYQMVEWAINQAKRVLNFQQGSAERGGGDDDDDELDEDEVEQQLNTLEPSESTVNSVGELTEWTTRMLARQFSLTPEEINFELEQIDIRRTSLWQSCPRIYRQPLARSCFAGSPLGSGGRDSNQLTALLRQRYRSHTGQCNNLLEPRLGSSFMPFVRLLQPDYADSVGWPRHSASGSSLPPARLVALNLHPDLDSPAEDHSMLFVNWGQLINHDLAMASNARDSTGHDVSCCRSATTSRRNSGGQIQPATQATNAELDLGQRVCMPIELAPDDPIYSQVGQRCHEFKRSLAALRPGCSLGPRTQLNTISSFVDASFVYGSTNSISVSLRSSPTMDNNNNAAGQMSMWNYFESNSNNNNNNRVSVQLKPLLPPQRMAPNEECVNRPRGLYCFRSGDSRTNQQIPLVVLHTIHTRHHNRLASGLQALNPHWSSGRIYEEARHIHIALVQHILLSEYLPLLLGPKQCELYNLTEAAPNEYWDHYDPTLNPGVSQEFAAAAFRQGHSSVPSHVFRFDPRTRRARRVYPLRSTYFQPWPLFEPGALDEFLVGLSEMPAQSVDPFVSLELSGHLLQHPNSPVGLDLIAINIQRGRDQGVASYNSLREFCGFGRFESFDQMDGTMSNRSVQMMSQLYETVDDIDLFSGGLSEFPLAGAQVGPTFACIIGKQFQTLRSADRFWFESSGGPHAFTPDQLNSIKQFTLARLICSNSDRIDLIQPLAMRQPHPILNPLQECQSLPELNLSLWMEPRPQQQQLVVGNPTTAQASLVAATTTVGNVTDNRQQQHQANAKTSDSQLDEAAAAAGEEDEETESDEQQDHAEDGNSVGDTRRP